MSGNEDHSPRRPAFSASDAFPALDGTIEGFERFGVLAGDGGSGIPAGTLIELTGSSSRESIRDVNSGPSFV
jgi:hypothetical protein